MADKIYNSKINKSQDWGGDASTGGLPVSGLRVQEFIKEQLENRMGVIYYDSPNTRYLVFADAENRDLYLNNPVIHSNKLLGTFLAPSEYSAIITLMSPINNNIFVGQKNNYIEFTFDITNKSGVSTGEGVICNYTIIQGNSKKVVSERYKYGAFVRFNLDEYLKEGVTRITVNVIGETSLAGTSVGVSYNMIDLVLTDSFNIGKDNPSTGTLEIPYFVSGAGTKKLEWHLDGVKLPEEENDVVLQTSTNRVKVINYSQLSHGSHTLQFRTYVDVNNERFYSTTHYKSFIVNAGLYTTVIGFSCVLPAGTVIGAGLPCTVNNVIQYDAYNITYSSFSPRGAGSNVIITHKGMALSNVVISNGDVQVFPFRPTSYGAQDLIISVGDISQTIKFNITKSPYNIEEITNGLTIDLRATGRSNSEPNRDRWVFGTITTTFTGFNWNTLSGWNGKELMIQSGSKIVINHTPFANDAKINGTTLEFVIKAKNIINPETVLVSCAGADGVGVKITAADLKLQSLNGQTVNTFYKANEKIRVTFVVHRNTGDNYPRTMFIYINGVINSVNTFISTDSFVNNSTITIGAQGGIADIDLGSVRAYSRALSPEEVLNNYILYQDDAANMLQLYDKNNIFEEGSYSLSVDKLSSKLPVMIFTGDVPVLLSTGSSSTKITLSEIEYINLQNPDLSFKGTGVELRPQGTSSMGYPIKNFRFYLATGTVYNNRGEKITATKIRSNSIPVSTFCLKADYAESSGTHNTGVARMWNDLYYNVKVDNAYVCRTNAQKAAITAGYNFDVRTAIDGYPIVVFYRLTKDSPLVFLGQYNFNNDKSTENVFGFKDIPTFNNANVACWEHLNNGHPIGLFTDISKFYTPNAITGQPEWTEAFESRYPKTATTANIQKLYDFALWLNSTKTDAVKFRTEKAQHLDLHKMAAYYVYVIRFGAVDQVVKNAMLTTEDGVHFYYIHYDNDTINGLRNDGLRIYSYDIDRTTLDPTSQDRQHAYAGKDSVLWNNLEADPEFMALVATMDNALYESGMSYRNVIDMFDNQQMGKWSERIYNENQKTKYLRPYYDNSINNLFMAQGNRQQHRRYWLSNRFSLYDGIFVSGEYLARYIEIKAPDTQVNTPFIITSGMNKGYFGYGINKLIKASKILLNNGDSYTFRTPSDQILNIGDPVRIYAPHFIKKVDLSALQPTMTLLSIAKVNHEELGSRLEELILGSASGTNAGISQISGIESAVNLKKLDIRGYTAINSIDLSNQEQLEELLASRSGLKGIMFAKSAPIRKLELPPQNTLHLDSLLLLTNANLILSDNGALCRDVMFRNCPLINTQTWVYNWIAIKTTVASQCVLTLSGINWTISYAQLQQLRASIGELNLTGTITITDPSTQAMVDWIIANFGSNVFNPSNPLLISLTAGIFVSGKSEVPIGSTSVYSVAMFPVVEGDVPVFVLDSTTNASITQDGVLSVTGNFDGNVVVNLTVYSKLKPSNRVVKPITLVGYNYPSAVQINSPDVISMGLHTITTTTTPPTFSGIVRYEWSLTNVPDTVAVIESSSMGSCNIRVKVIPPSPYSATLTCNIYKNGTGVVKATASVIINIFDPNTIATRSSNQYLCDYMFAKGFSASNERVTKQDALNVVGDFPYGMSTMLSSFKEFVYFENVTVLPTSIFANFQYLKEITLPPRLTTIRDGALEGCVLLKTIAIPDTVTYMGNTVFKYDRGLESVILPNSLTNLGQYAFMGCTSLKSIKIPISLTTISPYLFNGCTALREIDIPDNITGISYYAFSYCSALTRVTIAGSVTLIAGFAFSDCTGLTDLKLNEGLSIIQSEAFKRCSKLTTVTLPSTVTQIDNGCFAGCTGLTSINIPSGISALTPYTFEECQDLIFTVSPNNPNFSSDNGWLYNKDKTTLIRGNAIAGIQFAANVNTIGTQAFQGMKKLLSVTLPESIVTIGEGAFNGCDEMTSLTIPNSVRTIGNYAFRNMYKIPTLNIPNQLTSLGSGVFFGCILVTSIQLPDSLGNIPNTSDMFYNCRSLTSVRFPSAQTRIDNNCFGTCDSLVSITLPSGLTTIGASAFSNCSKLASISLPDTVTSVGASAFQSCSALASVRMSANLRIIPDKCFMSAGSLTSISFPADIASIGITAFSGCLNLTSMSFPVNTSAPTTGSGAFGSDTSTYTGRSKYASGTNRLFTKSAATGFNLGAWGDPLCTSTKCGFTLSKTL